MKYTHLTQDERYQIAILAQAGHDQSDIASLLADEISGKAQVYLGLDGSKK